MHIELPGSSTFSIDLSPYDPVGFHGTSKVAAAAIERSGFLPHKVFDPSIHQRLLDIAQQLQIETGIVGGYSEWLTMMSVTFTKESEAAIGHAGSVSGAGQGLAHMANIVEKARGVPKHQQFLDTVEAELTRIYTSTRVIYAVNLSGLDNRLVSDGQYLRIFWPYPLPKPPEIVVGSDRLLAKLEL